jgi:multicomponent K+:H+ antiporter subunit G
MNIGTLPALPPLPLWLDVLLALLVLVGTAFALVGSWGLVKLSDFLKRLHGPTKATTLGVGCVLIASALWFSFQRGAPSLHEFLITLFLFITAPVSAHLLVKAALKLGTSDRPPPPPPTTPTSSAATLPLPPPPPTTPRPQPRPAEPTP